PPAGLEFGSRPLILGTGAETSNGFPSEALLSEGLKTTIVAVPLAAMSLAGIEVVSCVLLTKLVVRLNPFQRTTESAAKLVPFTVSVRPGPPAIVEAGSSPVIVGVCAPASVT